MHDIDGRPSSHTRWLIEGACELLAKGFAEEEDPALYRRFLAQRNSDSVLAAAQSQKDLLTWAQQNERGVVRESDLYGAAMLATMVWTEAIPLSELSDELGSARKPMRGPELVALLHETSGLRPQDLLRRATSN